jgi:hypothetical protein
MSIQRTPPHSLMLSQSESGAGSTSNLSNYDEQEVQVNRKSKKRKIHSPEYNYKRDFAEFKNEIMNFMQVSMNTQIENMNKIRDEIRLDIQDLKKTTEVLSADYRQLQESVDKITVEHQISQNKLLSIEEEINKLKIDPQHNTGLTKQNEIYHEIQDRLQRGKNLIMVGLREQSDPNQSDRNNLDMEEVLNTLTKIDQACPKPLKVIRLGQLNAGKPRPVKIIFQNCETTRHLLKNRSKLSNNIKLYGDQTPAQRSYMQNLQKELKKREQDGESNLSIKYIKGVPTITKQNNNSKN